MAEPWIRRMGPKDVSAVYAIEAEAFAHPWTLSMFEEEMHSNPLARYLVLEVHGEICGFAGAHIVLDEGHVTNIAVKASKRGKGFGRLLGAALMQYAANLGVRYLTLEVRESNLRAQRLYLSLGFEKIHLRRKYYEDNGENAWLMVCDRMPGADPDFTEPETLFEE